jgi:outer membrane protein TolC
MRTGKTKKQYRIVGVLSAVFLIMLLPSLALAEAYLPLITLDDAFARAMAIDERIKIAERDIYKSRILSSKATTYFLPSMSAHGGYFEANEEIEDGPYVVTSSTGLGPLEIRQTENYIIVPKSEWRGKFEFLQPLYRGVFFPLRQQAREIIERSTETYYQTVQDTLLEVEKVYYDILRIKELVLNAEEILKLTEEELGVAKVKFQAGQVTEDIVLKAELLVTEADRKKIKYHNELRSAKDAFRNLICIESEIPDFDVVQPGLRTAPGMDYDFLITTAFENRYDHRIASLNVNVAESDIDIVKARFHPTLQATWDYYISDSETYNRDKEFWIGAITMEIPIFEQNVRICDLREKREALKQARLNLDARQKKIRIQVQDAILQVDSFQGVLRNLEKQVELAQKNYEIVSTQFEYGSTTNLHLNQALTDLDSAKTALIHETYGQQLALIDLERVLGIYAHDFINSASCPE